MEGDVLGVRIIPPVLIFDNAVPGSVSILNIAVKNVAGSSRSIRYYGPKSKKFRLKVKNPENPVASGLGIPAIVEYLATEEVEVKDRLVVTVDGEVIEVPIFAYPTRPSLELPSKVDFGNVLANSKVISKEISLVNSGSKVGEFSIRYTGDKPIAILPNAGSIPPQSAQIIKVEFVTKVPGEFQEIAVVHLEGKEPQKLTILGKVSKPALEILSCKDEMIVPRVSFGNTYYGTDRTERALLYNNGPEVVSFVAIVDENAVAQELGTDLTRSTKSMLAEEGGNSKKRGFTNDITSLITTIPNQGVLQPYQKIPIYFRFSPRWYESKSGWKSLVAPPPRKDFALFVRLEIIGSMKDSLEEADSKKKGALLQGSFAEVALTGTALPVVLDISPTNHFDFGECPVGEHVDVLCTIRNESPILPALFQFRRIAHFLIRPPNGKIPPGQAQDVILSFSPKQVGTFKPQQMLDVLGHVADERNPSFSSLTIISTFPIQLMGHSNPMQLNPKPRFNPGITPYISNEVGMHIGTDFENLDEHVPRIATLLAHRTQLHHLRRPKSLELKSHNVKVSFPNDRPGSIRPSERNKTFQTIFTRMERHNYVDPDYAFTDDDMLLRRMHRDGYNEHLHSLHYLRLKKVHEKEFVATNNPTDIGIKTAGGLRPKLLLLEENKPDPPLPPPPNEFCRLLSVKELEEAEKEAMSKPVQDGLNAVPTTPVEKVDCQKVLSPQELYQIVVGPRTVEFGKVCLRSVSQRELNVVNNLSHFILVEAEVDCRELRQSSPLSQVVPPRSRAVIPIIFESTAKGNFQSTFGRVARSVSYTVNKYYKNHVTVTAEVVPVDLELSTKHLVLKPTYGLPAEAGFRSVITLHNHLNYQAEFTWSPDISERGTAFSIRPANGIVTAYASLDCEVVWHPSYLAPEDGSFTLIIHGGNSLKLFCKAELGPTNISFADSRVLFGPVPVNLTVVRNAYLKNSGNNHAYFQVMDPNPFPGLTVTPVHGVIPVGGKAEISASLTPESILKFDTRIQVAIKGGKHIDLRVGGTIEAPEVDIDVTSFNFGGVYCGSKASVPFKMINKGNTKSKLEFDLTRYKDFRITFPSFQTPGVKIRKNESDDEDYNYQLLNPGMASVTIGPHETIEGELNFEPQEVAAYDFIMPVFINHIGAPMPAPTPFPQSPNSDKSSSKQHIINPRPQPVSLTTPRRHVIATALRQPLQLSSTHIEFVLPADFHTMAQSAVGVTQTIVLVNNSGAKLKWGFDLRAASQALEDGIFKFVHPSGVPFISDDSSHGIEGELEPGETTPVAVIFCPQKPGTYVCVVPVTIHGKWETPYQLLHITGKLQEPHITFTPSSICLTPVPLATEISSEFSLLALHYKSTSQLTVETPEVDCENGSKLHPLRVVFLDGSEISPCNRDSSHEDPCCLSGKVIFNSHIPVSFTKPIIFKDKDGRSFSLPVSATAENCMLTCYPFLALHRVDYQIVREQHSCIKDKVTKERETVKGEVIIVPVHSPNRMTSRPSTSATSSNFQVSSSSYESSASVSGSGIELLPGSRDGAVNKAPSGSDFVPRNHPIQEAVSRLGSAMFPDEHTDEGIFHTEVLLAAQRWFSANGWSGGPFPVIVPETLRKAICLRTLEEGGGRASSKKDSKTVYDMIAYLSGRSMPGIPINPTLPTDPLERVKQVYWQHSTLLTFLRCQGGCVASIRPEYLMGPRDFLIWQQLQRQIQQELLMNGKEEEANAMHIIDDIEEEVFEALSKRAWTDILLQILKTLTLAKVTPRSYKTLQPVDKETLPMVSQDPLASNIYSIGERILLTWLNHYYDSFRHTVWKDNTRGGVPPARWVVNYDFDLLDGLVLGALLGAYMPFLVKSHLEDMYTYPTSAEQCLHNAIKIVTALRYAGIHYDVQAIDITDPNPIFMLLLVVQLYQVLPQYIPKTTILFTGSLHSQINRQIDITNPSSKPLTYQILLAGLDAQDFSLPKGSMMTIPPHHTLSLSIEFTSRYLRPAEAMLVLVGSTLEASTGNSLTFKLQTKIDNIIPAATVKVESPCFELERVILVVENPFPEAGHFKIVLIELGDDLDSSKQKGLLKSKEIKLKKVKSKIDSRKPSSNALSDVNAKSTHALDTALHKKGGEKPKLSAFFTPVESVYLEANSKAEVEVDFLPFYLGERQCSIVFLNDTIGQFLYSIEAKAILPLPSSLPCTKPTNRVRITSPGPGGSSCDDDYTVYWKCEAKQVLHEKLLIPVVNVAKERALILASQQTKGHRMHMSDEEFQRRNLTGTLMSCSVTAKTLKMLATDPNAVVNEAKGTAGNTYAVEHDSDYFKMPETLHMSTNSRVPVGASNTFISKGASLNDGFAELPIEFFSKIPGHFPCQIILRSSDDIRVYHIECTVNPESSNAELQFSVPIHMSLTQDIPIVNVTSHDWNLVAKITGLGFAGPSFLLAKAHQKTIYPLVFRPLLENDITGKLILSNVEEGTNHVFHLIGKAEKPLPLENIKIKVEARKTISYTVKVPNETRKKLIYRVETDVSFITGNQTVTVLPKQSSSYTMRLSPIRRGQYTGVVAFIAGPNPNLEIDSDGDELPVDLETREYDGYRVWYSLEITVLPPPPEQTVKVSCACQKKMVIEVIVRNPTPEEITLLVKADGRGLSGPDSITLNAGEKDVYSLTYTPAVIGKTKGSLMFFHELVGEFWYQLDLEAISPPITTLPHMECELGRWTEQKIELTNPTDETLELVPTLSNINNFSLDRDNERPIILQPHASISVPLHFMPSTLGQGDHIGKIVFHSQQLGEWVFVASGTGLLPQPQDPVSVYTGAGTNTTLIIPFRNPMDTPIIATVTLKACSKQLGNFFNTTEEEKSPFTLLMKNTKARVGPKSTIDIPVSFAPSEMHRYEAICTVIVTKDDDSPWPFLPKDDTGHQLSHSDSDGVREIRWLFPIYGIPEARPIKESQCSTVECRARDTIEQRLEVIMSGAVASPAGPHKGENARLNLHSKTAPNRPSFAVEGIVVGETLATADEFSFELMCPNKDFSEAILHSVQLNLISQKRNPTTGLVTLLFNLRFSPLKTLNCLAQLHIIGAVGGVWKFPLRFVATEPPVDDIINIGSTGLGKISTLGFRLYSQTSNPVIFNAYFESGSDAELLISPKTGELLPQGMGGSLFTISFTPGRYGRIYKGKLIIQTPAMQWSYDVRGVVPEYIPPQGRSSIPPIAGPHPDPIGHNVSRNYVKENLHLLTTAVSSPIKGAPIILPHKSAVK